MEFGNEEVIIEDNNEWIVCPRKKVRVCISDLIIFFQTRKKKIIGVSYDPNIPISDNRKYLEAWEEGEYVNLGCLKENKESFKQKYIQLIKILNSRK